VSISPTIYEQLFCIKSFAHLFKVWVFNFLVKGNQRKKADHKMLAKFTTVTAKLNASTWVNTILRFSKTKLASASIKFH
jgi:hypothetical protein